MRKTYNIFLIAFSIIILFGGVYLYFSNGLNAQASAPISTDSSLVSQNETSQSGGNNDKLYVDQEFLQILASLTTIKVDNSIFSSEAFKKLNDNGVKLDPVETGRPNPFAPINTSATNSVVQLPPVVTNEALLITATTATLSGNINNLKGVTGTYFEYGPTQVLGKTTAQASPSLIGTFIINLNGLSPQTTYFYRAVAKVNGKSLYGEVISLDTH